MPRHRFPQPPASEITPEPVWRERRRLLAAFGGLAALPLLAACREPGPAAAPPAGEPLSIIRRTDTTGGEDMTRFADVTGYNNFYEFGTGKDDPARYAHTLRPRPWSLEVAGAAERTGRLDLEDVLAPHPLEERVYRLRCVEGWSMVIPWIGFPLADLLKRFEPASQARYVAFHTLLDPERMPGQRRRILDWPYVEALTIEEAMHPLSFIATGLYGQVLPNQNGAPLRLVVPWKYGFKSIKSIVRIEFLADRPLTSWERSAPHEYGFYANVNPQVDHPRWSQRSERRIAGSSTSVFARRIPTLLFNGYAEQVGHLYAGLDLRRNY
ncbi:MAG: protein-methionine-sulfoxide reductase catalytic subunit MsrP [Xanthomonadales bacterium]|nr:protein-methionine-sulfoxide reductase catalytic subunit MsrP [Xanthomonadales bacterium]